MRTPAARAGIAAAAVAAVVGLFLLASRSDGTSSAQNRKTKARPAAPRAPKVERIVVRGGKPEGGVQRLDYERGERVRFSVQTDVADEVHVHGFDITKALPANRRVRFGFPADIEGVFEVELHGTHTKIAELRIKP